MEWVCTVVNGVAHFIHRDQINSGGVISTNAGSVADRVAFAPYGTVLYQQNGASPLEEKFTGQILDGETGLYYYNARYYDPQIGVFISPDSVVPDPYDSQSLNRYMYVRGNPCKYTDPSGHKLWNALLSGIATIGLNVAGLATAVATGGGMGFVGYVKVGEDGSVDIKGYSWQYTSDGFKGAGFAFSYNAQTHDWYVGVGVQYGANSMGKPVDSSGLDYGLQNTAYQYYCNQMNKYWVMEKEMTRLYIALEDQKMLYRPVEEMGISGKPYLSSAFGYRSDPETGVIQWHGQIDIAGNKPWNNGSEGTVVLNTKDGYVLQTVAKENSGSWGNTVVVLHDNGMVSRYSHLETIGVRVEQRIWARDTIGIMGNTGYSKGIHLDYQLFPSYGAYLRHNPRAGIKTSINANLNFYHPYSPY